MRNKNPDRLSLMGLELYAKRGEIRIPDVQRELVWTKSQKQLLIDSLFKDYDIPKIYFEVRIVDGKQVFYVIDGQQRINAILEFLKNGFAMPKDADDVNGEIVANKTFSELSSDLQIELKGRNLDIVKLVDYTKRSLMGRNILANSRMS